MLGADKAISDGGEGVEMSGNGVVEVRCKPRVRIMVVGRGGWLRGGKARPGWKRGEVLVVYVRQVVVKSGARQGKGSSKISQFIS